MTSEAGSECYVYITLPGETQAVTAGRFTLTIRSLLASAMVFLACVSDSQHQAPERNHCEIAAAGRPDRDRDDTIRQEIESRTWSFNSEGESSGSYSPEELEKVGFDWSELGSLCDCVETSTVPAPAVCVEYGLLLKQFM